MAKSFKKAVPVAEAPKKNSEKDFLDFLEQERPAPSEPVAAVNNRLLNNISNISNTVLHKNSHVIDAINVTSVTNEATTAADVRQTFIISHQYLEQLKDYVHTRRVAGQYEYTQKQALHAALDLLFASTTIEPRPAHIREQEETRKQRIRRGLPK